MASGVRGRGRTMGPQARRSVVGIIGDRRSGFREIASGSDRRPSPYLPLDRSDAAGNRIDIDGPPRLRHLPRLSSSRRSWRDRPAAGHLSQLALDEAALRQSGVSSAARAPGSSHQTSARASAAAASASRGGKGSTNRSLHVSHRSHRAMTSYLLRRASKQCIPHRRTRRLPVDASKPRSP